MPSAEQVCYRAYGRVCASPIPLPELTKAPLSPADFDVAFADLGASAPRRWSASVTDADGEEWTAVEPTERDVWFRFLDESLWRCRRFEPGRWRVEIDRATQPPVETLRHLLIDEVLPALLAMSGSLVLHGAAVVIEESALVILGQSQMGKSTLGIAFAQRGYPLLADDCVVIDRMNGRFLVQPSYPSVRVWESSAVEMLGTAHGAPFAHYTDKRRYTEGLAFSARPVPLGAIATVDSWSPDVHGVVDIHTVRGHAASAALVQGAKTLPIGTRKAAAVAELLDLVGQVPIARLSLPEGFHFIARVCTDLTDWVVSP